MKKDEQARYYLQSMDPLDAPKRPRSKAVKRKVNSPVREVGKWRDIIVTVDPASGLLGFRPAGLRRTEYLPASACWSIAVKLRVALEQREKKRGKKK